MVPVSMGRWQRGCSRDRDMPPASAHGGPEQAAGGRRCTVALSPGARRAARGRGLTSTWGSAWSAAGAPCLGPDRLEFRTLSATCGVIMPSHPNLQREAERRRRPRRKSIHKELSSAPGLARIQKELGSAGQHTYRVQLSGLRAEAITAQFRLEGAREQLGVTGQGPN